MNRKTLLTVVTIGVIGTSLFGVANVSAQSTANPTTSLVQKIAQKFNLNQADVQAVFDQDRQDHQARMHAKVENRLNQAVSEGKLTEAQKQLILAKQKELQANRQTEMDNFKNLTPEERKTRIDAKRTELENWAKQNNIDVQYLMFGHGKGMKGGPRMH